MRKSVNEALSLIIATLMVLPSRSALAAIGDPITTPEGAADAGITPGAPTMVEQPSQVPTLSTAGTSMDMAATGSEDGPANPNPPAIPQTGYSPEGRESLSSTGREPIPVEPSTPVPKGAGRDKSRRSRLTKDETEMKADKRRVLVTAGEDKVVDLDFEVEDQRYVSVGNPTVVTTNLVALDGKKKQMIFKPMKAGETTVSIRDPEGNIRIIFDVIVTPSNLVRRAEEIRLLLKDIEGVEIKVVGPNVVIDGELLVPNDYARMVSVVSKKPYSDVVLLLASLSPLAIQMLARRVQEDIMTFAPNVRTRVVNGLLFLEGSVDDPFQAKRAYELAKLYLPEATPANALASQDVPVQVLPRRSLVQNFIVVNPAPPKKLDKLVKMTVHFVELKKDYNKAFGFNWSPGFTTDPQISVGQGAGGAGASSTSFTATISSLIPKLKSLQQAGFARVVKEATVIVRSGVKGTLNEEIVIPVTQQNNQGQPLTSNQTVGFRMAVTPTILGQSDDLQVSLTLSQSTQIGLSAAGVSKSQREVDTTLYVKSSESAAVSGFQGTDVTTEFNKDPLGGGNFAPGTEPLFQLKRTKGYTKNKNQFVVFVTPQIIESASDASEDLKKNFRVKVK